MSFTIYVTRDFDQMSQVAAGLAEAKIKETQAVKAECVLGLATGNSPTGLYKHLAKIFNSGKLNARAIRSFNLDEYVGLPGCNAQQRTLHCKSYSYFIISEFFALLQQKFKETSVPYGALVDQEALIHQLASHPEHYTMQGKNLGQSVIINDQATGVLGAIKKDILEAYHQAIEQAGGIDLQVVGVGGRGHVAFHESGIPFEGSKVMLVKLDDNTIENAVSDGNFQCKKESPQYAVSMGAELVYQARTVLLLANGPRKTGPVAESIFGEITCEVPISYGQKYAAQENGPGGELLYVLDEAAAADVLQNLTGLKEKGYTLVDLRAEAYTTVEELAFRRNPATNMLG